MTLDITPDKAQEILRDYFDNPVKYKFGQLQQACRWGEIAIKTYPRWRDIKQELPPMNTDVLTVDNAGYYDIYHFDNEAKMLHDIGFFELTHWIPIPEPKFLKQPHQ